MEHMQAPAPSPGESWRGSGQGGREPVAHLASASGSEVHSWLGFHSPEVFLTLLAPGLLRNCPQPTCVCVCVYVFWSSLSPSCEETPAVLDAWGSTRAQPLLGSTDWCREQTAAGGECGGATEGCEGRGNVPRSMAGCLLPWGGRGAPWKKDT